MGSDLRPGTRWRSRTYKLSAGEIKRFGRAYDPQPFHVDARAAKGTFFRGLAASGWHTAAITSKLTVKGRAFFHGGAVGLAIASLKWLKPVRPGDVLRVESELLSMRPSRSRSGRAVARIRHDTINARGQIVQTMVVVALANAGPVSRSSPSPGKKTRPASKTSRSRK